MVNRFENISKQIQAECTEVLLLAFLKMDDNLDSWTMVYSDARVVETEEGKEYRRRLFSKFAEILRDTDEADKKSEINRMGVFPLTNHIVIDALKYKSSTHITENTRMNGNIISEGYILVSKDTRQMQLGDM